MIAGFKGTLSRTCHGVTFERLSASTDPLEQDLDEVELLLDVELESPELLDDDLAESTSSPAGSGSGSGSGRGAAAATDLGPAFGLRLGCSFRLSRRW